MSPFTRLTFLIPANENSITNYNLIRQDKEVQRRISELEDGFIKIEDKIIVSVSSMLEVGNTYNILRKTFTIGTWLLLITVSCVDSYSPPSIPAEHGYLVVDGFADVTSNGTQIRLSRTFNVETQEHSAPPELNAQINIESEDGDKIQLEDRGNGIYGIREISLDSSLTYRLRIRTSDEKEYLSEYVKLKNTPAIDSVTWKINKQDKGISFYVYSHDPANKTRYYKWEYESDWQSATNCWENEKSTSVAISSSIRLINDIIYQFPVHFVPVNSGKLQIGYSLLVKQYGLTKREFEYHEELKKLTESLGGLMDPQPFKLMGNIKCTNCDEPVLGYFSLRSPQSKRVTISNGYDHLPIWFSLPSWELKEIYRHQDLICGPKPDYWPY